MEAKALLKLIKEDFTHLEEITSEFSFQALPTSDEVELAILRSKALAAELEVLHKLLVQKERAVEIFDREAVKKGEPTTDTSISEMVDINNIEVVFDSVAKQVSESDLPEFVQKSTDTVEISDSVKTAYLEPEAEISGQEIVEPNFDLDRVELKSDTVNDERSPLSSPDNQGVSENQIVQPEVKSELPPSVNDVFTSAKNDPGIQITPINSIWDGIGINDRFLFIKELFANSSAKFESTIMSLDELETIQDAVNYLKMNFKWNKTETSQKFLVLVKRRFTK